MVPDFREDFNARYTDAKYRELLRRLNERTRTHIDFRIAETPCFFTQQMLNAMATAGDELTHQLVDSADYMRQSGNAIPEKWRMPNDTRTPLFMTVDFGLVADGNGGYQPKLVELQAFPSLYAYQPTLAAQYIETFELDRGLGYLL